MVTAQVVASLVMREIFVLILVRMERYVMKMITV
jgi:hypothetical protein